jgi:hypothetical protein
VTAATCGTDSTLPSASGLAPGPAAVKLPMMSGFSTTM